MNLTEVLLSIIVSMAVMAAGFFLYTSVADRNGVSAVMQSLPLLRANIEETYAGNYSTIASDASSGTLHSLGLYPDGIAQGEGMASRWGDITLGSGDDDSQYTIVLSDLSTQACMQLGRFQYRSWAKVSAGDTQLWERGQTSDFSVNDLFDACKSGNVTITYVAP